jgi:DNA-binding transcriptional ArsR family regulator
MSSTPYIAEAASLIGDPARANMLLALMDGRALSATELAYVAGVSSSTASGHLAKLVEGRLIDVVASGRHRYFQISSPRVAGVIEGLMGLASDGPPRYRPPARIDAAMARARTCYDHLAGRLGVGIAETLVGRNQLELDVSGGRLTDDGTEALSGFGIDVKALNSRRQFCAPCLDWSERRWHVGGALGAAIAARCFDLGWIERRRDSRALDITRIGERGFADRFGLSL